ncbi:MAG: hypothetical protein Q4A71_05660 [Actinomycetaceae bacterium]|nr:hypothetical protein [Actinomycetaceae bacterium]
MLVPAGFRRDFFEDAPRSGHAYTAGAIIQIGAYSAYTFSQKTVYREQMRSLLPVVDTIN